MNRRKSVCLCNSLSLIGKGTDKNPVVTSSAPEFRAKSCGSQPHFLLNTYCRTITLNQVLGVKLGDVFHCAHLVFYHSDSSSRVFCSSAAMQLEYCNTLMLL